MKTCPTCQRTYQDDNQRNCPFDGAQLSAPHYPPPGQNPPQQYAQPPGQYPPQQYGQPPVNPTTPPPGYPPPGWPGGPPPAYQAGATGFVPCPQCRTPDPEKVGFTLWGGVLGPRMLSHVKCRSCGMTYNGKTGNSNSTGIVVYTIVSTVVILGIVVLIVVLMNS